MARLSARPIVNFQNINSFKYANQWEMSAGSNIQLYFQFIDLDQCGLRQIIGLGVSNQPDAEKVIFPSIDCSEKFALSATQDPNDGSVWSVIIPYTNVPQTGAVQFQVVQGSNSQTFAVQQMLIVNYPNDGSDGSLPDNTFFF